MYEGLPPVVLLLEYKGVYATALSACLARVKLIYLEMLYGSVANSNTWHSIIVQTGNGQHYRSQKNDRKCLNHPDTPLVNVAEAEHCLYYQTLY